jgi:chemotaxis protein CheX
VEDAVGEIANMIVGGFKTRIAGDELDFELSVPTVVQGKDHTINHFPKEEYRHFIIPFSLEDKLFYIEACLKK